MSISHGQAEIVSQTGKVMRAVYETEDSGQLSILTKDTHGYASAHLKFARERLGKAPTRVIDHSWPVADGTRARLTVWRAKSAAA